MRNGAITGLCVLVLAACVGEDRDEDILSPGPDGADDGADDPGDDGDDPGDDGGDPGDDGNDGEPGTGDDTGDPDDDGGDTGGDDGATDDPGDDGGSEGAPDCESMWIGQYIPATQYMKMKRPDTADEMFCWVNMNRINYQFHGRNDGCIWGGSGGGGEQVTWPYEMQWDADLTAAAQAEAEAVAAGSPPAGVGENNGMDYTLYADGCGTTEYTVTSPNDLREHWPDPDAGYFPDKAAGLSKSNGTARMGVFYYDPGPDAPTLGRMGAGLAEVGDTRFWVVKFGE